jgi:diaminopimelate epimerase
MLVETGRGILSIDYQAAEGKLKVATVDMGEPILDPASIPVLLSSLGQPSGRGEREIRTPRGVYSGSFVSMGNPHVVIFDDGPNAAASLKSLELDRVGPPLETHAAFPNRINAHFVAVQSRGEATMRTWERGAGATFACGTGACAVAVAGVLTGRLDRDVVLHLPGGDLNIRWDERNNHVFMTGPAADAFEGRWPD